MGSRFARTIECESLFRLYSEADAESILHCSAPGLDGDQATRSWQSGYDWWHRDRQNKLRNYARKYNLTVAAAIQSGRKVDEDAPGDGYLFDTGAFLFAETVDWSEGMLILDVD